MVAEGTIELAQPTSRETKDFDVFWISLQPFDNLVAHVQASILETPKSRSSGLAETSGMQKRVPDHRIRKSLPGDLEEEEEGLPNLEQLKNLRGKVYLNGEWVALKPHYEPDIEGNLGKLLGHCLVDSCQLFVCWFRQKRSLENHLVRKNPDIELESCRKRVKIAMVDAPGLAFHHVSENQIIHRDLESNYQLTDTYRDIKASNMLLDGTAKSTLGFNLEAMDAGLNIIPSISPRSRVMDAGGSDALNIIPSISPRSRRIDMSQWWHNRSYDPQKTLQPVKAFIDKDYYHVFLIISTLLAIITFHTALKLYLPACRFQGYTTQNPSVFQIVNQSFYSHRILIMFNSAAFFLSAAVMMILFNELPLSPWLLVSVISMVASYICTLMDLGMRSS